MVIDDLAKYKEELIPFVKEHFDRPEIKNEKIQNYMSEYILRGGKRLRPALFYYSYSIFSNKNLDEIKKLSIIFEFIQSFFLIHDDIMDKSDLRRGKPTVHREYEKEGKDLQVVDPTHYGISMAILAGDLSLTAVFDLISKSKIDDSLKIKFINFLVKELDTTIYGQIKDIDLEHIKNFTQEHVENVQEEKTAVYTFESPVLSGAILAGASDEELEILRKYSIPAGIAFQIRDDILGVFGDEEETGKSSAGDIAEGKKTLLVLKAYEKANDKQKVVLDKYIGKKDLTMEEAEEVRNVMKDTGSLDFSLNLSQQKVKEAQDALKKLDMTANDGFKFLFEVAEYMVMRNV